MTTIQDHSKSVTPPSPPSPSHLSYSIYQSAYSSDDPTDTPLMSNIQASMYHSAFGGSFSEEREETPPVSFGEDVQNDSMEDGPEGGGAKERKQRKSLMSRERQFCAQLAINEALLSVSNRGEMGRGIVALVLTCTCTVLIYNLVTMNSGLGMRVFTDLHVGSF